MVHFTMQRDTVRRPECLYATGAFCAQCWGPSSNSKIIFACLTSSGRHYTRRGTRAGISPVSGGFTVERWARVVGARQDYGPSSPIERRSLFRLGGAFHDFPGSLLVPSLVARHLSALSCEGLRRLGERSDENHKRGVVCTVRREFPQLFGVR